MDASDSLPVIAEVILDETSVMEAKLKQIDSPNQVDVAEAAVADIVAAVNSTAASGDISQTQSKSSPVTAKAGTNEDKVEEQMN